MKMPQNLITDTIQLEKDIKSFLGERIRKECPHVPVEKNLLSAEEFKKKYVIPNKPVILKGMLDKWPAIKKWEFDFFAKEHGDIEVNVNLYDAKNIKKSNLKSLISEIKQINREAPVYLQEWWFQTLCPDLLKDIIVPEHFADDQNLKLLGFYNSTLWIGSKGASTPVHQDTVYTNIWTSQIRGKKEWFLFDKNAVLKIGKDGKADYDEFLANSNNHVSCSYLEQGDLLYVPFKWWHRAQTLEDAISVNTFFVTEEISKRYINNVMAIPFAMIWNKELIQKYDPMRYNICMSRINILTEFLGYNKENVLGIKIPDLNKKS